MPGYLSLLHSPVHVSWRIAGCACGIVVGVAVAGLTPAGLIASWFAGVPAVSVLLLTGGLLLVCSLYKRAGIFIMVAVAAGILIGIWRGEVAKQQLSNYAPLYGHTVLLRGRVAEDASISTKGQQRITLADVMIDGKDFQGHVWVSTSPGIELKRGDTVFLRGILNEGFGSTAASMYRAVIERVERPYPGDVARRARDAFAEGVRKSISEPEASLGIGYLTGQRSALPATLDEELKIAGLTHIVVASGYNLTILVGFARRVFAGISKYLSTLFAASMIGCFVLIAGLSPSMSRAGLVAGLSLAAWYYGRTIHPIVLLSLAGCITVLGNPSYVWGDIGWYLSFAAFAGVIVVAPILRSYFWSKEQKVGTITQILTDTFAAQLVTAPIILYFFGQLSSYALIANVLVLPTIPLAMLATFIAGIAGLVLPGIAPIAGWPAEVILGYTTGVVNLVAGLPGAQETLHFTIQALVGSYAVIVLMCVLCASKSKFSFQDRKEAY